MKYNIMKYLFILLFAFVSINYNAQAVAIKLTSYSWNNPAHQFSKALNTNGRVLLDTVLKDAKVDTSNCIKADFKEAGRMTQKTFLKNSSYAYYDYSFDNGRLVKEQYESFNGYDSTKQQYCIIRYSTNGSSLDNITLYYIK